jgi:hypothetical protein
MDLSKLSVEQLKAMAYDQYTIKVQAERNIQVLEGEIIKRKEEAKTTTVETV